MLTGKVTAKRPVQPLGVILHATLLYVKRLSKGGQGVQNTKGRRSIDSSVSRYIGTKTINSRHLRNDIDIEHVGRLVQRHFLDHQRRLPRVLGLEDLVQLLEGAALGLDEKEEDDRGLDQAPTDEDEVELPADVLDGDGQPELVHHEGGIDHE